MEFKEIKKAIIKNSKRYSKKHKVDLNDSFTLIKLYEEIGELSEAFLTYKNKSRAEKYISKDNAKRDVAKELADVLNCIVVLAKILNIDLEEAVEKKIITREWNKR